ncbi:MAG: hypothetical protein IJ607_03875 [Bacteroidaceae bacterium]|nr:hypothetical protein [Bacteroidaceae bacterium]
MATFFTTTNFRIRITALKSVKRGVYASVEDEIRSSFSGLTIEQIRQNRDMILLDDEYILIKLRLPDKKHKLSKRDGFRLIYLVYKNTEEVVFMDIYPKNGPMQQLDIDDAQLAVLILQLAEEKRQNILMQFTMETAST